MHSAGTIPWSISVAAEDFVPILSFPSQLPRLHGEESHVLPFTLSLPSGEGSPVLQGIDPHTSCSDVRVKVGTAHPCPELLMLPVWPGPALRVPVLPCDAALAAAAGRQSEKGPQGGSLLCHLRKKAGGQDFPFSPAAVLLCCVHLPAQRALGETDITALQHPRRETERGEGGANAKQRLRSQHELEMRPRCPDSPFWAHKTSTWGQPCPENETVGATSSLGQWTQRSRIIRSNKLHTLSSLCMGLHLHQLLTWASSDVQISSAGDGRPLAVPLTCFCSPLLS